MRREKPVPFRGEPQPVGEPAVQGPPNDHAQLAEGPKVGVLAPRDGLDVQVAQEVLHAVVDLLVGERLYEAAEQLQAGRLVPVLLDELPVVPPQAGLARVAGLDGLSRAPASYRARHEGRPDPAGVERLWHPRRVADEHEPAGHHAVVLPPHRDLKVARCVVPVAGIVGQARAADGPVPAHVLFYERRDAVAAAHAGVAPL